MKVQGSDLTYCTNIHPGETFDEVFENLRRHVPRVRQKLAPDAAFGVGLRLSAQAARALTVPETLEEFRDFLAQESLYVFTLNGFPYGKFHGEPVKTKVYEPDWTRPERVAYTLDLAHVLTKLVPDGSMGSISTVPVGFKPHFESDGDLTTAVRHLLDVTARLHRIEREHGVELVLALEPEPHCLLETTAETVSFFEERLLGTAARAEFAGSTGLPENGVESVLRRHLGVCLDTCHAAVEFERPDETLDHLERAGIRIAKAQLSAGLKLDSLTEQTLSALAGFDEPVYLHQVVARQRSGALLRFEDLPMAFGSRAAREAEEWRVHFHVPLYTDELDGFANTQPYLRRILERHAHAAISTQLEVETYTWDVLPEHHRQRDVVDSIARELDWVRGQLQ